MNVIAQSPIGLGIDPHASRLIEETAAIVNDVDQRLTALKVGLSQAMPHLANALLWKEQLALTNPLARANGIGLPVGMGSPSLGTFGSFHGASPFAGVNPLAQLGASPGLNAAILAQLSQITPPWLASGLYGNPLSSILPQGGAPGVTNPFGIVPPFRLF